MANRKFEKWKTYRQGGQRVPGMFKRQEGGEEQMTPQTQMGDQELAQRAYGPSGMPQSRNMPGRQQLVNLSLSNAIKENQVQQSTMVNKRMTEMIMQMKLQNQALESQNELLKTQIEKSDLINNARNTKQKPGASNTPKRRGGIVKAKKGKEKRIMFAQSTGATMRHGGSCGPLMKRSKRR